MDFIARRRGRPRLYEDSYYARNRERLLRWSGEYAKARRFVERFPSDLSGMPVPFANFWANVEVRGPNECWLWKGPFSTKGYGVAGTKERAHRIAWEIAQRRPVPPGMLIMHLCDSPPCCNPMMLRSGTDRDNYEDARRKGRTLIGIGRTGEAHPQAKLSAEQVGWVRIAYRDRGGTWEACKSIATELGVTPGHINNIVKERFWR